MGTTPIRQDVTARLTERVEAAYAAGERDLLNVLTEVRDEDTLSLTVAQSLRTLNTIMAGVAHGLFTVDQLMTAMANALVMSSATGYAVGVQAYDERARELAELFTTAEQ